MYTLVVCRRDSDQYVKVTSDARIRTVDGMRRAYPNALGGSGNLRDLRLLYDYMEVQCGAPDDYVVVDSLSL